MDTAIQSRLDALDTALSTLIDSITSLNPSVPTAQSLLTADDDLQESVKHLLRHQANHNRITALRTQIASLNAAITSDFSSLVSLRSEILAQDITSLNEQGRKVGSCELLEYAQKISRYTVPPAYRPQVQQPPKEKAAEEKAAEEKAAEEKAAEEKAAEEKAAEEKAATTENAVVNEAGAETAIERNDGERVAQIFDSGGWVPWPSEAIIRQGPLGQIQVMQEQGFDPAVASVEQDLEQKADGMEGIVKTEGEQVARAEESIIERENAGRREVQREEKPKVFGGLDLYDPDEE